MKKIIVLLFLTVVLVGYGQKKPDVLTEQTPYIEYNEIKQILENKDRLGLTKRQIGVFTIKNEYVKRDLQFFNSKKDVKPAERNMYERDLKQAYELFVERTLTKDQLKEWKVVKTEMTNEQENSGTLKNDLKTLEKKHKANLKEIYTKYRYDRKLYYAQRDNARRQYETDRLRLIDYYKALGQESEEEVMTLEEIANLYKEYDDYYNENNRSSPLNYLNIQEEEIEVEEPMIEEGEY